MVRREKFPLFKLRLHYFALLIVLVSIIFPNSYIFAQEQPSGPVYIVQDGDSLWGIAARFGVSVDDLQTANNIGNPNALKIGDRLIIPGFEEIQGIITTEEVPFGDTLRSLSRQYRVSQDLLVHLNHLTGPNDLFAGSTLVLPEVDTQQSLTGRTALQIGESLLELAVIENSNPWTIVEQNNLSGNSGAMPGDIYHLPNDASPGPGSLPANVQKASIEPLFLAQGKAAVIELDLDGAQSITGSLLGNELHFFPEGEKSFIALQGGHAMTEPGIYPLEINATLTDGHQMNFMQMVPVKPVDYPYDQPLEVDPATIDPAITKPEDAEWSALAKPATPDKYWNGVFQLPSPLDVNYCLQTGDCWSSRYGNRRSYNGSAYDYFHTGLDIVGKTGTDIYAPADGQVVYTGPLTVRGNATMINHGHGVYTGYMHQSEILVKPGDFVKAGQLIGKVGGTGRVQGPHLHWEVWVGGIQVDPLDWLEQSYP